MTRLHCPAFSKYDAALAGLFVRYLEDHSGFACDGGMGAFERQRSTLEKDDFKWADLGRRPPSRPYAVLELLCGETLHSALGRSGSSSAVRTVSDPGEVVPLQWRERHEIFVLLAEACLYLEQCGLIHRDFRACNIQLCSRLPQCRIKILDFGVAIAAEEKLRFARSPAVSVFEPSRVAKGYDWLPWEVRSGHQNFNWPAHSFDVFSLGVLWLELLLGRSASRRVMTKLSEGVPWVDLAVEVKDNHWVGRQVLGKMLGPADKRLPPMEVLQASRALAPSGGPPPQHPAAPAAVTVSGSGRPRHRAVRRRATCSGGSAVGSSAVTVPTIAASVPARVAGRATDMDSCAAKSGSEMKVLAPSAPAACASVLAVDDDDNATDACCGEGGGGGGMSWRQSPDAAGASSEWLANRTVAWCYNGDQLQDQPQLSSVIPAGVAIEGSDSSKSSSPCQAAALNIHVHHASAATAEQARLRAPASGVITTLPVAAPNSASSPPYSSVKQEAHMSSRAFPVGAGELASCRSTVIVPQPSSPAGLSYASAKVAQPSSYCSPSTKGSELGSGTEDAAMEGRGREPAMMQPSRSVVVPSNIDMQSDAGVLLLEAPTVVSASVTKVPQPAHSFVKVPPIYALDSCLAGCQIGFSTSVSHVALAGRAGTLLPSAPPQLEVATAVLEAGFAAGVPATAVCPTKSNFCLTSEVQTTRPQAADHAASSGMTSHGSVVVSTSVLRTCASSGAKEVPVSHGLVVNPADGIRPSRAPKHLGAATSSAAAQSSAKSTQRTPTKLVDRGAWPAVPATAPAQPPSMAATSAPAPSACEPDSSASQEEFWCRGSPISSEDSTRTPQPAAGAQVRRAQRGQYAAHIAPDTPEDGFGDLASAVSSLQRMSGVVSNLLLMLPAVAASWQRHGKARRGLPDADVTEALRRRAEALMTSIDRCRRDAEWCTRGEGHVLRRPP